MKWAMPPCWTDGRMPRSSYEKAVRQKNQDQSSLGNPQGREDLTGISDHLFGPSEYDCTLETADS